MPETRDTHYEAVFDYLYKTYGPVVMERLQRLRTALMENGFLVTEPYDQMCDEYRWAMLAWAPGKEANDPEQGFDISISIGEQREYDGDEDAEGRPIFGMNFSISFVEYGGEIIGDLSPFNYTDECWVDARDPDAIEQRWGYIDRSDDYEASCLITDHYERKGVVNG